DHRALRSFPTRRSSDLAQSDALVDARWPQLQDQVARLQSQLRRLGQLSQRRMQSLARTDRIGHATSVYRQRALFVLDKGVRQPRSEEHTSELQSRSDLV